MANEGKVVIELVGTDSATTTFAKTFQDMQNTFQRLERSGQQTASSLSAIEKTASAAGSGVSSLATNLLALAGASYVGYKIASGFQEAIKSIDTYKTQVIQIASTLTSLSEKGQGPIDEQFTRNLAFAEQMYRAINLESAKHFATANEGMLVYNQLVQKGYGARMDEVGALLQLTDLIKLNTAGQNQEIQMNQEVRALMDGQAKATSVLAMNLKTQLGPGWDELVEKHKRAGDLLQWIVSLYPGLDAASGKIQETWTSQYATLQSLLQILSIDGLGGAYEDIVNYVKQINDYLRTHHELAGQLERAWQNISPIIFGIANAIGTMVKDVVRLVANLDQIGKNPVLITLIGAGMGAAAGSRFGTAGAVVGGVAGAGAVIYKGIQQDAAAYQAQKQRSGLLGYGTEGEGHIPAPAIPTKLRKPPPQDKGGGGGAGGGKELETAQRQLENFIQTMNQAAAQGAGDTEAILSAWKAKQLQTLEELARKGADVSAGKLALAQAVDAKQRKLDADFTDWYTSNLGDQYAKLQAEENKKLATVAGNEAKIAQVHEVYAKKRGDLDYKVESATVGLFKGYLDTMAGLTPVVQTQISLKERSLDLELRLAQAALERQISEGQILPALADEARGYQALVSQAKRFNLERQSEIESGSLKGWAYAVQDAAKGSNTVKSWLDAAGGYINDAFSQGLQGALSGNVMADAGKKMAQSFLLELNAWTFKNVTQGIAKLIAPPQESGGTTPAPIPAMSSLTSALAMGSKLGGGGGATSPGGSGGSGGSSSDFAQYHFAQQFSKVADQWQSTGDYWKNSVGTTNLQAGQSGQLSAAQAMISNMQLGVGAAGLGLSAIGLMTGSQGLVTAGMVLQGAALALQIAVMIMKATSMIPGFHGGGLVAHHGLLVAHNGLANDERLVKVLTGEPILQRSAMAKYSRMGITFDDLNNARLPVVAAPGRTITTPAPQQAAPRPLVYSPTYHFSAIDAKGMDAVLKEHLPRHERTVRKMLASMHRNGVKN